MLMARDCGEKEQAFLATLTRAYAECSEYENCSSWGRLVVQTLLECDLDDADLVDWLLIASVLHESDLRGQLEDDWKRALFRGLLRRSRSLTAKRVHLRDLCAPAPVTTRHPFVWLHAPKWATADGLEVPCDASAEGEEQDAWVAWVCWLHNVDKETASRWIQGIGDHGSFSYRLVGDLMDLASLRHKMGLESVYVWSAEWDMIDDPMHAVETSLPTWETSVHPLAETVKFGWSRDHSAYLALRLGAWIREPPFNPSAQVTVFVAGPPPEPADETVDLEPIYALTPEPARDTPPEVGAGPSAVALAPVSEEEPEFMVRIKRARMEALEREK
jgi:hypothetical protein